MTYSTLLSRENILSQYLVIMQPRRYVTSWTLVNGTKYYNTFTYGHIISLDSNGVAQTEATSTALADGTWFWDYDSGKLYLDIGADPSTYDIVVIYELYFGTYDAHFYRDPLDNTSRQVYFEPLIVQSPTISTISEDVFFGFMPVSSSAVVISNLTHYLQPHLYDSSFYNIDINIYHYLSELSVSNVSLIYKGMCNDITYTDTDVSFKLLDRTNIFQDEYRQPLGKSFFSKSTWGLIDPLYINRPIRSVFGRVDGFIPCCIAYKAENPTTANNRTWIACDAPSSDTYAGRVEATVPASPVSTTTRTYVDSNDGLIVGDTFWMDDSRGLTYDDYEIITAVGNAGGSDYIEHAAITWAAASNSKVKRSYIGQIVIKDGQNLYYPLYSRDFIEYRDATNYVQGFIFDSNMEINLSIPTAFNPSTMLLYCRVYGHKVHSTLGGSPFGSNSIDTGVLSQGVPVLYRILKDVLALAEADIDTATFTSLQASVTDDLGFAVPSFSYDYFPTYKDVINQILQSLFLKIFIDNNNKWSLVLTAPFGAYGKTIEDDEIIDGSINYSFSYNDIISDIIVRSGQKEISDRYESSIDSFRHIVYSESSVAERLHKISKQKTFNTLHSIEAEAQTFADRLSFLFGDRLGNLLLTTKNRFFDSEIGDIIRIQRTRLPGFEYDKDTNRTIDLIVQNLDKSLSNIRIGLSDQKGIEDNESSW